MKTLTIIKTAAIAATALFLSACDNKAAAAHTPAQNPNAQKIVAAKILAHFGEAPTKITAAPIPNYQMAMTSQGSFFVSNDGNYMIFGRLFDLSGTTAEEITDSGLNEYRKELLEKAKPNAITYTAASEQKHEIYVFTDITCGYCRKLHTHIEELNKAGVTVHYLAFPRSPASADALQKVWCSSNQITAMDQAQKGQAITENCTGKEQVIAEHAALGSQFGVHGTPALVLENGTLIPGYQPAAQLLQTIANAKK